MNDRLEEIFKHKRVSSEHFRAVQKGHGLVPTPELLVADPNTREGTHELHKGLHWINLELSEFISATPTERPEELADVLHFLIEFCILAGFDHNIIAQETVERYGCEDRLETVLKASVDDAFVFDDAIMNARFTILQALQVADLLKNKPWKQTLKILDPTQFRTEVNGLFYWFGATVRTHGIDAQTLFDQFTRKENINYERIATGV
jgi:hypothetical protein